MSETEQADPDLETFRRMVKNEQVIFTIQETPSGRSLGVTTTDSPDHCVEPDGRDMFSEMIDTYEELVIRLHDIHERHTGEEKLWRMGRAVYEHTAERGLKEPFYKELAVFLPLFEMTEEDLRNASALYKLYDTPDDLSNTRS